jgi:hypothetical protein
VLFNVFRVSHLIVVLMHAAAAVVSCTYECMKATLAVCDITCEIDHKLEQQQQPTTSSMYKSHFKNAFDKGMCVSLQQTHA